MLHPGTYGIHISDIFYINFFSYTNTSFSFVNHHWGSGILSYIVFAISGWNGLSIVYTLLFLSALYLMQAVLPKMRERKFGRIINITSAMVKSPRPQMALSTGARAGLTAFSKSLSLEVAVDNVTINSLLPERIDTDRQRFMAEKMMKEQSISMQEARDQIAQSIAAKRFGTPKEFGDACAYLCSAQASFISGQNLQLDGGSYHGLI
jgi:3-oxoacyl-[acyl-carrier protein] reductase